MIETLPEYTKKANEAMTPKDCIIYPLLNDFLGVSINSNCIF